MYEGETYNIHDAVRPMSVGYGVKSICKSGALAAVCIRRLGLVEGPPFNNSGWVTPIV